jgi:hypothetical protein
MKKLMTIVISTFLICFLSCNKADQILAPDSQEAIFTQPDNIPFFSIAPGNIEDALQQTLSKYDSHLKSQNNAISTFMQGVSMINNPTTQQTYELINKESILKRISYTDKNARTSPDGMLNIEEINKVLNSKDVSKHTRKHLLSLSKELEKVKSKSSKDNFDMDKEILGVIESFEKNTSKDSELNEVEKVTFATISKTLQTNYQDIKKNAEKAQSSKRTSCWICTVVNVIITVVIVSAVVAVAVFALVATAVYVVTATAITMAVAAEIALLAAGTGALFGVLSAAHNSCFTMINYGQSPYQNSDILGMQLSPC